MDQMKMSSEIMKENIPQKEKKIQINRRKLQEKNVISGHQQKSQQNTAFKKRRQGIRWGWLSEQKQRLSTELGEERLFLQRLVFSKRTLFYRLDCCCSWERDGGGGGKGVTCLSKYLGGASHI